MNGDDSIRTADAGKRPAAGPGAAQERSFPLVALLQLATFLAAMVACIDGRELASVLDAARRDVVGELGGSGGLFAPQRLAIIASVVGGCCGLMGLIGFAVGLGQVRMWRSALVGGCVGGLYGLAILAVYVAPAPIERALAAAAVLVLTTIAFRLRSA